jgi:2-octaprenyl-3-methyl-6-methoxy-1,4-benzoquinol hydroxylase
VNRSRADGGRRGALDVVVVGAGVVGAAAALALAQSGQRVALVEAQAARTRDAAAPRDLRVFAIAPGSRALLEQLGVWAEIAAQSAQPYRDMRIWDAGAAGELHFSAHDAGVDALGHIVEQGAIQDALWRALQAHERVVLHAPSRVVGLTREANSVALELDDGSRLQSAVVVAADGADSPLRALAGLEVAGHAYGQRGVVAYLRTELPHADTAWQRFLPGGPLAVLPCTDGLSSIVWTVPDAEAERLLAQAGGAFEAELTRAFDARLGAMQLVSERAAFPLRMQLAPRYVAGRVVLIGDAAHVVHPLAGQGVNLGLQDVAELVANVRRAAERGRDPGDASVLRRYERVRRSENAIAARTFDGINRIFSNAWMLPTVLRGPVLGLIDRVAPLKRLLAQHAMGRPDAL